MSDSIEKIAEIAYPLKDRITFKSCNAFDYERYKIYDKREGFIRAVNNERALYKPVVDKLRILLYFADQNSVIVDGFRTREIISELKEFLLKIPNEDE